MIISEIFVPVTTRWSVVYPASAHVFLCIGKSRAFSPGQQSMHIDFLVLLSQTVSS